MEIYKGKTEANHAGKILSLPTNLIMCLFIYMHAYLILIYTEIYYNIQVDCRCSNYDVTSTNSSVSDIICSSPCTLDPGNTCGRSDAGSPGSTTAPRYLSLYHAGILVDDQ